MKKFFVAIAALVLGAAVASAQDYNAAVEAFNAGATALETSKTEAIAQFRNAMEIANNCGEEEAAELIAKCENAIVSTLMSISKDKIKEGAYDEAIASLAETKATAEQYGNADVAAEAEALVPKVYMQKGSNLLKEKDFAGAAAALEELVKITPEDGQAYLMLGQAKMQSGDLAAATEALEKAAELGKADQANKLLSNAYLKQGQALLKAGKNAEAIAALEKANAYLESGNAYKLIASAYTKMGKSKEAIDAYKKYLAVTPNAKDSADIMFTIAATAQKAGDKATAKEYYQKLAGSKYAAQAEAQLKTL